MKSLLTVFTVLLLLLASNKSYAHEETFEAFIKAYNLAFQPNAEIETINTYLNFYAEDVEDVHPPYNVTVSGRDKQFEGIHSYTKRMKRYHMFATKLYWSENVASVIIYEDSEYMKRDELRQYRGKTVLFMEFDEEGKIKHIRRHVGG